MKAIERYREKIKARIKASNEREKFGLPPDPWVVEYRKKNNKTKAAWSNKKPKKEPKKRISTGGYFKIGNVPHNKMTAEEKKASVLKARANSNQWHKQNKERVNATRRLKRQTDPNFKIAANLRKRLSFLVRKKLTSKTAQTMTLLGCSVEELMIHLQKKFKPGMSFENYGLEWHIDHVRPCASFDLTKESEQKLCFHYSNLQPLWKLDNLKKNKKY